MLRSLPEKHSKKRLDAPEEIGSLGDSKIDQENQAERDHHRKNDEEKKRAKFQERFLFSEFLKKFKERENENDDSQVPAESDCGSDGERGEDEGFEIEAGSTLMIEMKRKECHSCCRDVVHRKG